MSIPMHAHTADQYPKPEEVLDIRSGELGAILDGWARMIDEANAANNELIALMARRDRHRRAADQAGADEDPAEVAGATAMVAALNRDIARMTPRVDRAIRAADDAKRVYAQKCINTQNLLRDLRRAEDEGRDMYADQLRAELNRRVGPPAE